MSTPITIEHKGIKITYNESKDIFEFELRGMSRTAPSIKTAKQKIDMPPRKVKKPFERFPAYRSDYGGEFMPCEVTSLIEPLSENSNRECWVSFSPSERRKTYERNVYPLNAHNTKIADKIRALMEQAAQIDKAIGKIKEKAKCYERPVDYDTPKQD